jgi:coenzyme PQQ precursor peptide PqqA
LQSRIANRRAMFDDRAAFKQQEGVINMWRKPTMTEICTGAEINSYISAAKK